MIGVGLMTDHVTVSGRVMADGGNRSLIPAAPDAMQGSVRTDCGVALIGSRLPPAGTHVSVDGQLSGRDLTVSGWNEETTTPAFWGPMLHLQGVDPDISHAVLRSVPADWDLISTGESKTSGGGRVAFIHLVRATPEVTSWLAGQVPDSVHVYPFIRERGMDSVLIAGSAAAPPHHPT
jgi:hypothetical protein